MHNIFYTINCHSKVKLLFLLRDIKALKKYGFISIIFINEQSCPDYRSK
jgi:hypothetical protein